MNTINIKGVERVQYYYELLEKYDLICFEIKYREKDWNKKECLKTIFDYKGIKEEKNKIVESNQRCATLFLMKKTKILMNLIDDWLKLCKNYQNINDILLENQENYFKEHRHDQSVFSVLTKIYEIKYGNIFCSNDNYHDEKEDLYLNKEKGIYRPFIPTRKKE